ncbi:MAG: hypothetical protein AAFV45_04395 [Pseudomonadota bacterium]
MITAQQPLTSHLAMAFGAYMLAAAIGGWLKPERWAAILREFKTNDAVTFVTAAFTFALGVALILAHNIWTDVLAGTISAVGWLVALKGLLLMINPMPSFELADRMLEPRFLKPYLALVTALGAALLIAGLTGAWS